jgi:hypothetical protein
MPAPKTSPRPKKRPDPVDLEGTTRGIDMAPKTSPRPKKNPRMMAKGGKCRGMGAAKRGGDYKG